MRVRSRRLRSAMSDFRPYLRARFTASKMRTILMRWCGSDEDVALVALEIKAYAKGPPPKEFRSSLTNTASVASSSQKLKIAIKLRLSITFARNFRQSSRL